MNPNANGLNSIKTDSRAVGWRQNALEANVGTKWTNTFKSPGWTTSVNATKVINVDLIAVYTNATSVNYILTTLEEDWISTPAA